MLNVDVTPEVNQRPGRIWRVLQFSLTRIVVAAAALITVRVLMEVCLRAAGVRPHSLPGVRGAFLIVIATLATYYGCVRFLERRRVVELAWQGATRELGQGLLSGALLFAAVMLVLGGVGVAHVSADGGLAALPYALLAALVAAVWEEALFRGVLFRIVEQAAGSWIALALSAGLFGGVHAFNPGATFISSAAVALEAGVLLGAVYMYSRRLWMPIGLHAGWNFTEGGIFGASVSGGQARGMLSSHFRGPDVLTGARFGPEASIVAVAACLALGVLVLALAVRRGRVLAPGWRRRRAAAGVSAAGSSAGGPPAQARP